MPTLRLSVGRDLEYRVAGAEEDPVVLFHHGTPGSRAALRMFDRVAADNGLRVLTYSRAGAGGSTRHRGRSVADVVPDLVELLDHVGAERCVTVGWSGGGPFCLAMGALAADRVAGVLCIAGVGPYDAQGLDFLDGMADANVQEFTVAAAGEEPLRALLDDIAPEVRDADAAGLIEHLGGLLPPVDKAQLTDDFGDDMAANFREALRVGFEGWLDDDLAFVKGWGFDVGDIAVPTTLLHGDQDLMVPFRHGQWLAAHIPGAVSHLLPGQGHLSLAVDALPQALAELRATLGDGRSG